MSEENKPNENKNSEVEYVYNVDQGVSINSFIDVDLDGEIVRFNITSRHNVPADKIMKDLSAHIEAYRMTRQYYPKPELPPPPEASIQEFDEGGVPVVDGDGKPVMTPLPDGVKKYTVEAVAHTKSADGSKDILKVFTVEREEFINRKYGVSCFHAPEQYSDFKSWPLDSKYAPKPGAQHVIIRAPANGGRYADVIEFQA